MRLRYIPLLALAMALGAAFSLLGQAIQGVVPEAGTTIAVAPVINRSGTPLANVELGVAGMLSQALERVGFRTVPAEALQSWCVQNGLSPWDPMALREAAGALGAGYVAEGTVESLHATSIKLALGPIVIEGAAVNAELTLRLFSVAERREVARFSARGEAEGKAGVSLNLNFFLSLPGDVCAGGFRANKATYLHGEPVILGYRDPNPWMAPNSFYVVVEPLGGGPPTWTSSLQSSTPSDPCVTWTWDQMFGSTPASPGMYRAYLYDNTSALIATLTFQIRPEPAPWGVEIRVGTPEFSGTAWYKALDEAVGKLAEDVFKFLKPQA